MTQTPDAGGAPKEDGRRLRYRHRREELRQAATEHALEHGIASLSLRTVAETAGVSHATLVHHFGTKERLVAEIVEEVLTRAFSSPGLVAGDEDPLRALWRHATSERGLRSLRLFAAVTGHALHDQPELAAAVRRSLDERTALLTTGLRRAGCPAAEAAPLATLALGAMRGLVADLLVTGDRARVDAAVEVLLADLARRAATWRAP
ncbi:TetR/AcrR family transcriptional regulator [Kineococcus glutinatus]|uniref:TetR/AcrR family transcriptional regulator n=1 Tax=Kineococcus glutinatus TaxID=1070872 RepID=A0ABP9H5R2_9ACTN